MDDETLTIEGQTTSFRYSGTGDATIVLISGLGDGMETWNSIADPLQEHVRVFMYNRPGYGGSSRVLHGKDGRDGRFVASHLKLCLDATGSTPPYNLVGHSMGGLYALAFARFYRDLLSGLLLIDGRMPTFSSICQERGLSADPNWLVRLMLPGRMKAEVKGARGAERQAALPESLNGLPVTAIVATKRDRGMSKALFDVFQQAQLGFIRRVAGGRMVLAENSGHYIHQDEPSLVIREILRNCRDALDRRTVAMNDL